MKLKLKSSELEKCTLVLFNEDQLIDGKVKYLAGKIYPIQKTSVDRWIKRGCQIFTEEMEDAMLEKGEEAAISIPLFDFEHLVEPVEEDVNGDNTPSEPLTTETETTTKNGEVVPPQPPTEVLQETNEEETQEEAGEEEVESPKSQDGTAKKSKTGKNDKKNR